LTIAIARSTPAQKPRGFAKIISIPHTPAFSDLTVGVTSADDDRIIAFVGKYWLK
jgi:hypothetical protein